MSGFAGTTLRERATTLRSHAAALRRQAEAERRRTEELADRLAQILLGCAGRPFGDRDDRFFLRLGRLRPLLRFARGDLQRWLDAGGVPQDVAAELTLAFSEACANAVEHPHGATRQLVEVEAFRRDGTLELRVRDYGAWSEHGLSELRGRGLAIARELVDSLDVRRTDDGTQVVMRRSLSGRCACS